MKTRVTLILVFLSVLCWHAGAQMFSRLSNINNEIFEEYEVPKYKESKKITLPNKHESIIGLYTFQENIITLKTQWVLKDEDGKDHENCYYEYNFVNNSLLEITERNKIDEINREISNHYTDITDDEDSFHNMEAKEKFKRTMKEVGEIMKEILKNQTTTVRNKNYRFYDFHSDKYVTLYYVDVKYDQVIANKNQAKVQAQSFSKYMFYYCNDSIDAEFKLSSATSDHTLLYDSEKIQWSKNMEYVMESDILFDLKQNHATRLFYAGALLGTFDYNNEYLILFNVNPFRQDISIDVLKIKPEWVQKMSNYSDYTILLGMKRQRDLIASGNIEGEIHETSNSFIDPRDGKRYWYKEIGKQTWMMHNLNYGSMIPGANDQDNNSIDEKYCYNDNEDYCKKYGGLYQWDEVMKHNEQDPQGICPDGWHIPSTDEWEVLIAYLGGEKTAGGRLKSNSPEVWEKTLSASNESGFCALGAGFRSGGGDFKGVLEETAIRTSSKGRTYELSTKKSEIKNKSPDKDAGFSVRCIKD
ncbi:MAG: hypothetical protein KQI35_14290 [Bacteroidetes bacterium]|nr:hypothetical protein [Bacteroidota bacterium]